MFSGTDKTTSFQKNKGRVKISGLPAVPRSFAKFFLKYPRLVPLRLRWQSASKALGLLLTEIIATSSNGSKQTYKDIVAACKYLGEKQANEVQAQLGLKGTLKECIQITILAERLFGLDPQLTEFSSKEARIRIRRCPWAEEEWWGAKACAALSAYEAALCTGLNNKVKVKYTQKIPLGGDFCEAVFTLRVNK